MLSDTTLPTADERLAFIWVKIERAKKHIVDLQREIDSFLSANPYGVIEKKDPKTGELIYEMSSVKPVPEIIAAITGDAIQNLRSALDHLAYQLLLVRVGAIDSDEQPSFPIANTRKKYEASLRGIIKKPMFRQDAIDALVNVEAHKGGNGHEIWVLNRLNNRDKHRSIITVGSATRSLNLGGAVMRATLELWKQSGLAEPSFTASDHPGLDGFFRPAKNTCPLKIGDVLWTTRPDIKLDVNRDFRFEIAINEPEIIERKPLIETIQHFADLVSSTVLCFRPCLS